MQEELADSEEAGGSVHMQSLSLWIKVSIGAIMDCILPAARL